VGEENSNWIVNAVAEMAVKLALHGKNPAKELRWATFLNGHGEEPKAPARKKRKPGIPAAMNLRISD
jgi:hypothetical protein